MLMSPTRTDQTNNHRSAFTIIHPNQPDFHKRTTVAAAVSCTSGSVSTTPRKSTAGTSTHHQHDRADTETQVQIQNANQQQIEETPPPPLPDFGGAHTPRAQHSPPQEGAVTPPNKFTTAQLHDHAWKNDEPQSPGKYRQQSKKVDANLRHGSSEHPNLSAQQRPKGLVPGVHFPNRNPFLIGQQRPPLRDLANDPLHHSLVWHNRLSGAQQQVSGRMIQRTKTYVTPNGQTKKLIDFVPALSSSNNIRG